MIYSLDNTNLLDWFDNQATPTGILHQANCFHTMGGGIARQIAMRFPEAYEADKRDSSYGDRSKLGTFTYAEIDDPNHLIYNLYSQFTFGMGRQTLYDAMVDGLERIRIHAISKGLTKLGLPFNMGCTLGGGNWKIVRPIIDSIFATDSEIDLWICKYEP
jgi:O-acetyl-ADP-ribose deacetylase (regulator of RNase III)